MFTKTHLILGAAVWIALASALSTMAESTFHGTVVSTNGGQLTLSAGGELVRFFVEAETEITLDGQEAQLTDLTSDHEAVVTASRRGEDWTAVKVDARSQKIVVEQSSSFTPADHGSDGG